MNSPVTPCRIKFEIDNNSIMEGEDDGAAAAAVDLNSKEFRGQRKSNQIVVENYANRSMPSATGILPPSSREVTPVQQDAPAANPDVGDDINFISGNPFVEVTKGVIHLFKKNERTSMVVEADIRTICLLAVPTNLNCHDLLRFIAPCQAVIQHVRIIRDGAPNQFMVLLEFRCTESAVEFYDNFNGIPFNSLEPENLCHAIWVSGVEWGMDGAPPLNHTELPTCPVCLERMDESVDGVLTILCNHAFHANCLIKWGDSTCPVCRYVQTPELTEESVCMECEGKDSLWICLICGHVGCGRYQGGHAASHYHTTNHTYALQLGSNRVWDYAGDNFVHRLLQSKTDGKLVQTQSTGTGESEEKIDSIQLEFTYLLTSQLDAQREYYEEKLNRLEQIVEKECSEVKAQSEQLSRENQNLESRLKESVRERVNCERKLQQMQSKLAVFNKELSDEKFVGKALRTNQSEWQGKFQIAENKLKELQAEKEAEIAELKEQIRDLMFFMEAQSTIEKSGLKDEISSGSVVVPTEEHLLSSPAAAKLKTKGFRNKKKEDIKDFFGVYLLVSSSPDVKYNGGTYIGYTVDPNRRIKQHNRGVRFGGAKRTSNAGPWKMVLIVHGFLDSTSAMRFEWAWQQPKVSRRLNTISGLDKKRAKESQFQYKFRILYEMLRIGPWNRLPLTIRWLSEEYLDFPPLKPPPMHMIICSGRVIRAAKETMKHSDTNSLNRPVCTICGIWNNKSLLSCINRYCQMKAHIECLAAKFLEGDQSILPIKGQCLECRSEILWGDLIRRFNGALDLVDAPAEFLNEDSVSGCSSDEDQ